MCVPAHVSVCVPAHVSVCVLTHASVCIPAHVSVCVPAHVSVCVPAHVSMYVRIHVSVYVRRVPAQVGVCVREYVLSSKVVSIANRVLSQRCIKQIESARYLVGWLAELPSSPLWLMEYLTVLSPLPYSISYLPRIPPSPPSSTFILEYHTSSSAAKMVRLRVCAEIICE